MLDLNHLRPLSMASFAVLERGLPLFHADSCELSAANLCMWQSIYNTMMLETDNNIRIFCSIEEKMLWYPYGIDSARDLAAISDVFEQSGFTDGSIYCMPEELLACDDFARYFQITTLEDDFDYIYDNQSQQNLTGHKLRKKRNLVKQFESSFPLHQVIPITPSNAAVALQEAKKLNALLPHAEFIDEENQVMDFAFKHWHDLHLQGVLLESEPGVLCGFSVWSLLHPMLADIHFEKALHQTKGASQFLTQAVGSLLYTNGINFMNREQDMGNAGIRQAKMSLDPIRIFRNVRLKRHAK